MKPREEKVSKAAVLNFPEPKKARLYYLDKKTNRHKRLSDNIFRDLQYITRPNDRKKRISLKARNLLTNLIQMILKNHHKEEFVDHTFLSQITEVYSSKQNARLLDQISDIIDSTYHAYVKFQGKSRTYGYVIKLTEDGYERAKNPIVFYSDLDGQKCPVDPTKMSTQVDKNVQIYKDKENPEEEINHSYANGFISEKEKNYKKEKPHEDKYATFAPCFPSEQEQVASTNQAENSQSATSCSQLTIQEEKSQSVTNCHDFNASEEKAIELERRQRTSEHTGLFAMSDLIAKVLNEPQKTEEVSKMNLEELPKLTEKEERTILLSRSLRETFGEERSNQIHDSCIFQEPEPDKVSIYVGSIRLSDMEKDKIRQAIRSVYGDNVKIIGIKSGSENKEQEQQSNEKVKAPIYPISKNKKATWLEFKAAIRITNLINILTNPVLKIIETPGKVIIETVPFLIERLTAPGHFDELERVVFQTGLTLELHSTNPHPEYKNFHKDPIVISPGKILEDQEFRQTYEPLVLSEILEEAKRSKEEK